jgi:hypothetical protein
MPNDLARLDLAYQEPSAGDLIEAFGGAQLVSFAGVILRLNHPVEQPIGESVIRWPSEQ